jgi:hypothetical protein
MFIKVRDNVFIGDGKHTSEELKEAGVNKIVSVAGADEVSLAGTDSEITVFYCPIRLDRKNPGHIKDLACHCPKFMVQNGDKVLVVCDTGRERSAYIVARMLCEIEGKSIYDILLEMQEKIDQFDLGKAYF